MRQTRRQEQPILSGATIMVRIITLCRTCFLPTAAVRMQPAHKQLDLWSSADTPGFDTAGPNDLLVVGVWRAQAPRA